MRLFVRCSATSDSLKSIIKRELKGLELRERVKNKRTSGIRLLTSQRST